MHRKCEISATGLLLGLLLILFPGGRDCGITGARAAPYSTDESSTSTVPLAAPSAVIPLPHIIQATESDAQSTSPYLAGLSSSSRCPTKVAQSAHGLGMLQVEATGASSKPALLNNRRDETGGLFFLRHSNLVNIGGWRLEQGFGDQYAKLDELVLSSNRFSFANTKMRGVTGVAHNNRTHISWAFGNLGELRGSDSNQFEVADEDISGIGINHQLNRYWQVSAQLWTVNSRETTEYQSLATVAQYTDTENQYGYSVHLINDSDRRLGVWFDMDVTRDKWRHLYSIYRFDPKLAWATVSLPDDRQGAYWRTEYTLSNLTWSGGMELEQSNLDQDPARAGHLTTRGFGGLTRTLSETTTVKGRVHAEDRRSYADLSGEEAQSVQLGLSLEQLLRVGQSRFDFLWSTTHTTVEPKDTIHLCWDQDWNLMETNKITTRLALDRHTQNDSEEFYPGAAFIFSRPLANKIEFISSLYYVMDAPSSPMDMKPWSWCDGQVGCVHGTGGSVWLAMKASLN